MFKSKLPQQEQGFTLVEVLVAILLTTIFVTVAMQAIVIAAFFKVRARQFAEATLLIQQDLENVKYEAGIFEYTSLTANANSNASSINVASVANFAVNDSLKVGSDPTNYTISGLGGGTTTLNITPNLGTAQLQGAKVVRTTRCKSSVLATIANQGTSSINVASGKNFVSNDKVKVGSDPGTYTISGTGTTFSINPSLGTTQSQGAVVSAVMTLEKGFADALRDHIVGSNQTVATNTNSINFTPANSPISTAFTLKRTITITDAAPFNKLQLDYDLFQTSGGSSVAKLYTEVIPDAALQCP